MTRVSLPVVGEVKEPYSNPSASALGLVELCDARAGARYVARLPDPEGEKAKLGTRCHKIAEEYLRDGAAPNRSETFDIISNGSPKTYYPGRIVSNILHHLPPAGSTPNVEHKVTLVHRGITFNGSIDWTDDKTVGDHKFTSALKYAKTADDLVHDPQRILYAADWFSKHDADVLNMQWTYGAFDAKSSKPVRLTVHRGEVMAKLDSEIMPLAERLLRYVSDNVDWRTLPKNFEACSKFPPNGCPYVKDCPRSFKDKVRATMGSEFLEKLKAKKAAQLAGGAEPTSTVAAVPASPVVNDAARIVPSNDVEHDEEDAAAAVVGAINPPGEAVDFEEEPEVAEPVEEVAPVVEAPKRGRGRPKKDAPAAAVAATPSAADVAEEAARARRRETVKAVMAKTQAALEAAAPATSTTISDSAAQAQISADIEQRAGERKGLVLLVDCVPLRGMSDVTHASDLIEQAHAHVRASYSSESHTCLDYRDGTQGIDFGKGAGFLVASIKGLIEDLPSDTVVFLDTRSAEGSLVLQSFLSAATTVVRGV